MKSFLKVLILMTGVALVSSDPINYSTPAVIAQEAESCFMVNSSGNVINLTELCGSTPRQLTTEPRVFQAKIKRREGGTPVIDLTYSSPYKCEDSSGVTP